MRTHETGHSFVQLLCVVSVVAVLDLFALVTLAALSARPAHTASGGATTRAEHPLLVPVAVAAAAAVALTGLPALPRLRRRPRPALRAPSVLAHQHGQSLLEILTVLAIIAIVALAALPALGTYRRRSSVVSAANELRGTTRLIRSRAIARSNYAGIKFTQQNSGAWSFALYDDGDRDGIRNDDIRSGVDRRFAGPSPLMPQLHAARVGLLPYTVKDPDGAALPPSKPAVAFNNSTICSFSPLGTATPGSLYLTDDAGELYCLRVYGPTGRVRLLRYDGGHKKWELR